MCWQSYLSLSLSYNKHAIQGVDFIGPFLHGLECFMILNFGEDYIDLDKIHASGQSFRWVKISGGHYIIIFAQSAYRVIQRNQHQLEVLQAWGRGDSLEDYFDLSRPYTQITTKLMMSYPELCEALVFGEGIRLLKQEPFEMLMTFMMSANNHIPRIRSFVARLSELYGKQIGEYEGEVFYAFPDLSDLLMLDEGIFKKLGAGYRSSYFFETLNMLNLSDDYEVWHQMETDDLIEHLRRLKGVGLKVAQCVALFGYGRWECFPIDTWIKKALKNRLFLDGLSEGALQKMLEDLFGPHRGLVQQFLFYYERSCAVKENILVEK
jgi:N-glycosylase/DNA lyase